LSKGNEKMTDEKEKIEEMKLSLAEAMRRVPASVANGSYQMAVQYKKDYAKADKIRNKKNPKINELGWAIGAMTHQGGA
jgi:hypothetical protein